MEDNASKKAEFCVKGCGFYGNPLNNNMCSKCFKEFNAKNGQSAEKPIEPAMPSSASTNQPLTPTPTPTPTTTATATATTVTEELQESFATPNPTSEQVLPQSSPPIPTEDQPSQHTRPVQSNKARCFMCRAKIPLAKQTINKCRCEYVFCDTHKVPDKHDCDFDFAKMGKDILAKNNPKLNDVHKGGRSFNRID